MIITEQKPIAEIISMLGGKNKVFLFGCGECATACKTGGLDELNILKQEFIRHKINVEGAGIPDSTCVASKVKTELAKNRAALEKSEAIVVFACGLGAQTVKANLRQIKEVYPGCNSLFAASMDAQGNFLECCSLCGSCLLDKTEGICPVSRCPKGILNGPCGGVRQGKCEVNREQDCAWVLIYKELEAKNKTAGLSSVQPPRNFKISLSGRSLMLSSKKK